MRKRYNFGFSLFEVVVTMAIVAIFVAACSNVFTQKYKKKPAIPPHGRMECFYDNAGQLTERMLSENVIVSDTHPATGYCTFRPLTSSSYLIINAVGGGGAGGQQFGGSKGEYQSLFLTTTTHTLHLYPGNPANVDAANNTFDPKGEDSYILDADDADREILRVSGGRSNSGSSVALDQCSVSYAEYSCRLTPSCTIDNVNQRVTVTYCAQNGNAINVEKSINIEFSKILAEYSGMTTEEISRGILIYRYNSTPAYQQLPITYFALSVFLEGNFTQDEDPSELKNYITGLEIKDGIASVVPEAGNGGAVGSKGGTGAILIVW